MRNKKPAPPHPASPAHNSQACNQHRATPTPHPTVLALLSPTPPHHAPPLQAGITLAARIRSEKPDIPLLLQSAQPSESDLAKQAESLGARFVSKNDPSLLSRLREFMLEDMSFGPLTFRRGVGANEPLGTVSTVTQLMHTWERLPLSSIAYHARNCDLSRWFNARAEFALAKRFKASNFPEVRTSLHCPYVPALWHGVTPVTRPQAVKRTIRIAKAANRSRDV
jgi:CheY-like chemotaxis protein